MKAPEPDTSATVAAVMHFSAAINGDIGIGDLAAIFSLPEALVEDLRRFLAAANDADSRARVLMYAANYFTFSAGASGIIAMFIPAEGAPQWREIAITASEVAAVINFMRFAPNAHANLLSELDRRLARLTEWLPCLGSYPLLISPYGHWHEIPLHLLPLQGGVRLGQARISSRLYGANVLATLLTASAQPPGRYLLA